MSHANAPLPFDEFRSAKTCKPIFLYEEDSPFEIVRATVSNQDDQTLPVVTFRFWFLGISLTILLSIFNQVFWFRTQSFMISIFVVQLLSFPLGKLLARILPQGSLNPGPFNIKEHVLITAMVNASTSVTYAVDLINIKKIFFGYDNSVSSSLLLVLSIQFLGLGIAGLTRRFLVQPASMIWPASLVNVSLFRTMHELSDSNGARRFKFFMLATGASFLYYFLPGFVAPFLASVSLLCLFAPQNRLLNQIGSGTKGFGLFSFAFDWQTIVSYLGSPLITPFWAQVNIIVGFVFVCWLLVPIGYYTNVWDAQSFPIVSTQTFHSNGTEYSSLSLINDALRLNQTSHDFNGPLRLSYFFAISYGMGFAALSALITHTLLYHGRELFVRCRQFIYDDDDIHAKLMRRYERLSDWLFVALIVASLINAIIICSFYDIKLPVWGVLLAFSMALFFSVPIGIMAAIANQTPGINAITEITIGYLLPGQPLANATFKAFGYTTLNMAMTFVSDMKLGHYMKVPPKLLLVAQSLGIFISALTSVSTSFLMQMVIPELCMKGETNWQCPNTNTSYVTSVIWGSIGPGRIFNGTTGYNMLFWFFLVGLLLPVPFWLLARRYPSSMWRYVHTPVILGVTAIMPPARAVMFPSWFLLGLIFQYYVYRYRHVWWKRYNYILSAALDVGVAFGSLVIFLALKNQNIAFEWWGTREDCNDFPVL